VSFFCYNTRVTYRYSDPDTIRSTHESVLHTIHAAILQRLQDMTELDALEGDLNERSRLHRATSLFTLELLWQAILRPESDAVLVYSITQLVRSLAVI
jgi:hypothetical protein